MLSIEKMQQKAVPSVVGSKNDCDHYQLRVLNSLQPMFIQVNSVLVPIQDTTDTSNICVLTANGESLNYWSWLRREQERLGRIHLSTIPCREQVR